MIELIVAIASACLLTMRPLLKHVIPSFVASAVSKRTRSRGRSRSRNALGASKTKPKSYGRGVAGGPDSETAKSAHAGTVDGIALAGYYPGGPPAAVKTKITARPDPYALDDDEDTDVGEKDDEKAGQIRVTQEGPVVTVEPRGGGSDGDGSSTGDLEAARREGGSASTSTKELWPLS